MTSERFILSQDEKDFLIECKKDLEWDYQGSVRANIYEEDGELKVKIILENLRRIVKNHIAYKRNDYIGHPNCGKYSYEDPQNEDQPKEIIFTYPIQNQN